MLPISARFQGALESGTFQAVALSQVYGRTAPTDPTSFGVLLPPPGNVPGTNSPYTIPVLSGSVVVDTTQPVRSTVSLTLVDQYGWLTPATLFSPLSPLGNEIWVWSGMQYPDGTQELIPAGVFAITQVSLTYTGTDNTIMVSGSDRGYTVGLRLLQTPTTLAAGSTLASALSQLVTPNLPNGAQLFMDPSCSTITLASTSLSQGDNPWSDAVTLCANAGLQCYFDVNGNCVVTPVPDPSTQSSVWTYAQTPGGLLLAVTRNLSQQATTSGSLGGSSGASTGTVSNAFYMIYQGTQTTSSGTPPIVGSALDQNPQSPMFVGGPYGLVPQFVYTGVLQGQDAADAAAAQLLAQSEGQVDSVTVTCTSNPALQGLDVVTVDVPAINLGANYVVSGYTTPLGLGPQTLTLRAIY